MSLPQLLVVLLITVLSPLLSHSANGLEKKLIGSKECTIARYCSKQNAVDALQSEFNMTENDAITYIDDRNLVKSCSCHSSCSYLGLCCEDFPDMMVPDTLKHLVSRLSEDPSTYTCQAILGRHTVVVDSCPYGSEPTMNQMCAKDDALVPLVTSSLSGLTYKNFYCGMCNGERISQLDTWSWNFDCRVVNSQFLVNQTTVAAATLIDKARRDNCILNTSIPMIPPGKQEIHDNIGVYFDTSNLCSSPPISSCPVGMSPSQHSECVNGANQLVTFNNYVYKNIACLTCNQQNQQNYTSALCESCENEQCKHPSVTIHNQELFASFGILVQPYNTHDVVQCKTTKDQSECNSILQDLVECGHGQILDYQTSECQDICPENFILQGGSCVFIGLNATCKKYIDREGFKALLISQNHTKQLHGNTFIINDVDNLLNCYNCEKLVAVSPENSEYTINADDRVSLKSNEISSNLVYRVDDVTYYACLDGIITTSMNSTTTLQQQTEELITYIFLTISIISLFLYFMAYGLFKRLRNVPGKIVAGNMVCLLMAYIFFAVRFIPGLDQTIGCKVVAVLVHYFFLASFIFNIIYAGFIVHSLDFVDFESSLTKWTAARMWMIGLFTPFVIVAPALILDQTENVYRPEYGGKFCFIDDTKGVRQILYFVAPIGIFLFVAVSLYLTILIKLAQLAKQTRKVRSDHSEKITVALKLLIVLGFNWVFAIIAAADTQGHITTFIFIATCTLQGFFGFVVFICNAATIKDIKKCMNKHPSLPNFEMSSSSSAKSVRTKSTDMGNIKTPLRQADSNRALLRIDNDNSSA